MGTCLELTLHHDSESYAQDRMTDAFEIARRLEKLLSRFDSSGELFRINQGEPRVSQEISEELETVLKIGKRIENLSERAFRLMPECPHRFCYEIGDGFVRRLSECQFDLGGLAKGYIVDRIFEFLRRHMPNHAFSVNAGGDLRVQGGQTVEIRVPGHQGERRYSLALKDGAIATSSVQGDFLESGSPSAHYSAVSPFPATTVSVVAESCAVADAMTKVSLFSQEIAPELQEAFSVRSVLSFDSNGATIL